VLADVAPTVAGGSNISWTGWALEGILVLVVGALLLAALRFMFRATFDKLLATSKDTNAKVSNGGNSRNVGDIAPRLEDKVERTNEKIERTESKVDQLALVVATFKSEVVTAATENRLAAASAERHAQSAASAAKGAAQAAAQAAIGVARIEAHLGAQDTTIGLLAAALKAGT
jgi:hypothetical protein